MLQSILVLRVVGIIFCLIILIAWTLKAADPSAGGRGRTEGKPRTLVAAGAKPNSTTEPAQPQWPTIATFSILGFDPDTGEIGAAVQSRVFNVGNGVLWVEADMGAVATQASANVGYGPQALELLRKGVAPEDVIKQVREADSDPLPKDWSKEARQFAVMNAKGHVAAYTGPKCQAWAGDKQGKNCTAQGNILAGEEVVDKMVEAFENTKGHLAVRLAAALEAGQTAGGDKRGMQSAALMVVKKNGGPWLNNDSVIRLQVDDNPEPIRELQRLVDKAHLRRKTKD